LGAVPAPLIVVDLVERFERNAEAYPIPLRDNLSAGTASLPEELLGLGQQMISLHATAAVAKTDHKRALLERQIEATDREIDRLVYQLYGLTDEEITVVENSISQATAPSQD
jgi:hypothetical protein